MRLTMFCNTFKTDLFALRTDALLCVEQSQTLFKFSFEEKY